MIFAGTQKETQKPRMAATKSSVHLLVDQELQVLAHSYPPRFLPFALQPAASLSWTWPLEGTLKMAREVYLSCTYADILEKS